MMLLAVIACLAQAPVGDGSGGHFCQSAGDANAVTGVNQSGCGVFQSLVMMNNGAPSN